MCRTVCLLTVLMGTAPGPMKAQRALDQDSVPPAGGRVASQLALGALGGMVGLIGLCFIGAQGGDTWLDSDSPGLGGCVVGGTVGLTIGSALGVYLGGHLNNGAGTYLAALAGSAAGVGAFALIASGLDADYAPFYVALIGLPTTGGILAYAMSHRERRTRAIAAPWWHRGPGLVLQVHF